MEDNEKYLLRIGFILLGIGIIASAIGYIFLSLVGYIMISYHVSSAYPILSFIFSTIAFIFLIVVGALVIKNGNNLDYTTVFRLGLMLLLMFIFLGISDFLIYSFASYVYNISILAS